MKIRTFDELSEFLRHDLAWRRKELRVLEGMIRTTASSKQQAVLRGAIAALYAHWEGFVKTGSSAYIDFVRMRRLRISELGTNFIGLVIRGRIKHLATSENAEEFTSFVEWLLREWDSRAYLPPTEKLSTQSNLSGAVFKGIVKSLGLPYRPEYSIAETAIIDPLLGDRNNLAHGEWQVIEQGAFEQYAMWIDRLLVIYCDELEEAAISSRYKRSVAAIS